MNPQENIQPISVSGDYFTEQVNSAMAAITDEQMYRLLSELEGTEVWWAILKYNQSRLRQSQSAIIAGDPFKDPTNLARHQGIMLGLSDLQNAVVLLKREYLQKLREEAVRSSEAPVK